ncbi:hypothetical protein ABIC22_003745 [Paenibacillus sp. PvP094]
MGKAGQQKGKFPVNGDLPFSFYLLFAALDLAISFYRFRLSGTDWAADPPVF